jgi:isopentenyl-diphosphate delta-isomerase
MEEQVILVDENDNVLGEMPKMEAHEKGVLHRAFSVFIFNDKGETMLQRRADSKYHSPGLWSNSCCSHPRLGETNVQAGERRLQEEMGFTVPLKETFSFIYKAQFGNGLTEHELDYVLIGRSNEEPQLNPTEVSEWKWIAMDDLSADMKDYPEKYTFWFNNLMTEYLDRIERA